MCRFVAYHGSETVLRPLLFEGDHPLVEQAWAPRELLVGHTNADGYGVAWYRDGLPVRLARAEPIWYDPDLERLLSTIRSTTVVASLRNATPGMPIGSGASAPLTLDRWTFTLNGFVQGFHRHFKRGFHERLSDELYARLRSANDTETLFLLAVQGVRRGDDLADALLRVVRLVRDALAAADGELTAQLNMVLSDGDALAVARASTVQQTNSLYVAVDPERIGSGVVFASEALDHDPAWRPVEPQSVVLVDGDGTIDARPVAP